LIKELNYSPDKLNDLIYQKSVNVSALAKKLDTYYIYIHNIQKNVRQPSLDMAMKLAMYFDMSVEELFYK
jgi:DNA-binding XRE family transcriptional regulator